MKCAHLLPLAFVCIVCTGKVDAKCEDPPAPGVDWRGCYKHNADLKKANLSKANLTLTEFVGADLSDANLTGATMDWAILTNAKVTGTIFKQAYLGYATWTDGTPCRGGQYGQSVGKCDH
jgi:Pentapeptide repeats (8 copies)